MKRALFLSLSLTFATLGCGGDDTTDGDDAQADTLDLDGAKADAATTPSGTYTNAHPRLGEMSSLTLADDHTFARTFQVVDCIPLRGCGPETGTYRFSHSGSSRYIRFLDDAGTLIDRYQYKLSGTTLQVRAVGTTRWTTLAGETLAHEGERCGGFVAHPVHCAAGLECRIHGNPDLPGICEKPAQQNACQAAGGSCVALYPGSCANGTVGDARTYSCGGGLGVQCCLP